MANTPAGGYPTLRYQDDRKALQARFLLDEADPDQHTSLRDKAKTLELAAAAGVAVPQFWHPATGKFQNHKPDKIEVELTRKNARGRAKTALAEVLTEG